MKNYKEMVRELVGENNYGNSFITDSAEVREKDPDMYDWLLDELRKFVYDEDNLTNEKDIEQFKRGEYLVEYTFRENGYGVAAGRDGQNLAQQPFWNYDSWEDIHSCIPEEVWNWWLEKIKQGVK